MLAAAVVPHPPILIPALAAGAAGELASLLAACDAVLTSLLAASPALVLCVGSGERTWQPDVGDWGSLAGFGAPAHDAAGGEPGAGLEAPSRHDGRPPVLPLSLTVGRWLLERAGWTGPVLLQQVATGTPPLDCARLGAELAAQTGPEIGWLVLGDGTNRRGPRSPGHDDVRAEGFDAEVVRAFAEVDLAALLALDAGLAAELGVAGRAPWQVLAGAAQAGPPAARFTAEMLFDQAPFGVQYLVAGWSIGR